MTHNQFASPGRCFAAGLATVALVAAGLIATAPAEAAPPALITNPVQYVQVFGGTGNGGGEVGDINDFPGPAMPFGMVQFSPDSNGTAANVTQGTWSSNRNGAGYHWPDRSTRGFSMTHASQGCSLYGDIPIIPSTWSNLTGTGNNGPWSQRLAYSKPATPNEPGADEYAEVGYYRLDGTDANGAVIRSELGATTRAATATFTYPEGTTPQVFLKPSQHNNSNGYASALEVDLGSNIVYARATSGSFCGKGNRYTVYYALAFDQAWSGFGTWQNGAAVADRTSVAHNTSQDLGGYFSFTPAATGPTVVRARMAISYVSYEGALANLTAEIPTLDASTLDTVRANSRATWNSYLSKIEASEPLATGQWPADDPTRDLKTFYTAFYHSITHPSTFSDVDGKYIGFEGAAEGGPVIHNTNEKPAPGGRQRIQYSSFSDWDTYRCQAALVAAFWPDIASDQVQSLVNAAEQMGSYPQWTVANSSTNQMTGDNIPPLIASTYAMGARDFDTATALQYMVDAAIGPHAGEFTGGANTALGNTLPMVERPGAQLYNERHYAPQARWYQADHAITGASYTEEYALDDFAISQYAAALGEQQVADTFFERSHWWQNLFNPTTNYIQPRDLNGKFPETNPMLQYTPDTTNQSLAAFGWTHPNKNPDGFGQVGFDEGNAEQYLWFVPHNISGLITALGGHAAVEARLASFFSKLKVGPQVDERGGPYMFAGNEPNFNAPWIYNYLGEPSKSQEVVDRISQGIFGYGPTDAIPGNDDLGAQSSLLVWAGIGAYPVTPGTDVMAVNTPMFEQLVIHPAGGKTLTIKTANAQSQRDAANGKYRYITAMLVNDQPTTKTYFGWSELADETVIEYTTASQANDWGTGAADAPPSWREGGQAIVANLLPGSNAYFGVMAATPGGSAAGRLDVQRIESTAADYTVSGTVNYPGITLRPVSTGQFDAVGHSTTNLVWDIDPFVPADIYQVTASITTSDGQATVSGNIRVNEPYSLESYRTIVGTSYYDAPRGRFDNATGSATTVYLRDLLDLAGFTPLSSHDLSIDGVDLTFRWPGAPHQYPEAVTLASPAQQIKLDRPAQAFSMIGAASPSSASNVPNVVATVIESNGTTTRFKTWDISVGDWKVPSSTGDAATGNLDPAYNNTKVLWTARNAVQAASNTSPITLANPFPDNLTHTAAPGPYIWATKPYKAEAGWKVISVTLPAVPRSGTLPNPRYFAIAQDSPTIGSSATTAPAGGAVAVRATGFAANEPVTLTLNTTPASTMVATADWQGEVTAAVHVPRAAALGDYVITVSGASVAEPLTTNVAVNSVATYNPVLTVQADSTVGEGISFNGSGFEPGEQVTVTIGDSSVTVVANAAGAISGVVPAPSIPGDYPVTAEGELSGSPASTAPIPVAPAPEPPTVTVTVPGPTVQGPTVEVPGPTVTAPAATVEVPGPTVTEPGATVTVPGGTSSIGPSLGAQSTKTLPVINFALPKATVAWGSVVSITAAVGQETGQADFYDGTRLLGSAPLVGGQATFRTTSLPVGAHALSARFAGNERAHAVTSSARLLTVVKATPAKVTVSAKAFAAGTRPKISLTVAKLSNGQAARGKVAITVGGKTVKTVKLPSSGKVSLRLPKAYAKTIKVKAKYQPTDKSHVAAKASKTYKVKVK
ncbi:MAG: GH92 family glycosyl hydrolase [Bifidobacteriaceae bacterium]|jgi:predicted alpha-1,2-mannosidase|nr:GH92 family glycosyl hydrolase [Bifidobacteriaceae bacterium]